MCTQWLNWASKYLGPILRPITSRMISNRRKIQTPMNPMMILGHFNFSQPEEQPSIWARIRVFPCLAFTPEAELHNRPVQHGL